MINQSEMCHAFASLGIQQGDTLLVHSALSALGHVEGGPDAVIDALLEALGPGGTLMMPALSSGTFDHATSPSKVGLLTETFRTRPGVLRSFHPSHSVTALGPRAEAMITGHLDCPTACGEGTPYVRLMEHGGKILLLGVDQDRNTSLHGLEAMAGLPYLKTITRDYIDPADGSIKTIEIKEYPGPHRDFIGLDCRLRVAGAMVIGKVGKAVCRLMDARAMRDVILPELRRDPTLILCENPLCNDCVMQRASVRKQRLGQEDFILSVVSDAAGHTLGDILRAIEVEGINNLELRTLEGRAMCDFAEPELAQVRATLEAHGVGITAVSAPICGEYDPKRLITVALLLGSRAVVLPLANYTPTLGELAAQAGLRLDLENSNEDGATSLERLKATRPAPVTLAFNPARFAAAGEKPFLKLYSKTQLKRWVGQLRFSDGTFEGSPTTPGRGNGEVVELLSILRCASFDGPVVLDTPPGFSFSEIAKAFRDCLEHL